MRKSADPETGGPLNRKEYLVGIGFAATQQYFVGTYVQLKTSKAEALQYPPNTGMGVSFDAALTAGANIRKHQDDWGIPAMVSQDTYTLRLPAQQTIKQLYC